MTYFYALLFLILVVPSMAPASTYKCEEGRTLRLDQDFDNLLLERLDPMLDLMGTRGRVSVYINSNGGSVPVGNIVKKTLSRLKKSGVKIECVVDGKAMSMAFSTLEVCDRRIVQKDSNLMFHQPYIELSGDYTLDRLTRMQKRAIKSDAEMVIAISAVLQKDITIDQRLNEAYKDSSYWTPEGLQKAVGKKIFEIVDKVSCKE